MALACNERCANAEPSMSELGSQEMGPQTRHFQCHCGAESGRARKRAQGDIPCDGTWCAARRQEAEERLAAH